MENSWEILYKNNEHHSVWPWTDLISEVKKINIKNISVLELGCGMGANIPFFISEGHSYYGIDASQTAISYLKNRFPEIHENLIVGDFTSIIPFENKEFNLIFDRGSVTHNDSKSMQHCIKKVSDKIKNNGFYIGIDWFSKNHSDYESGLTLETGTKTCINSNQFKGTGKIHFFDQVEITNIFKFNNFKIVKMEEKIYRNIHEEHIIQNRASFNFVAVKQ